MGVVPKLIDHQERETAIIEAAWRVLVRDGVAAVSVRNVAAEAGLATASLRRAFPTQTEMLVACLALMGERVGARIRGLRPRVDPVADALARLGETMPLDEERRVEMEVYLALGITALNDSTLRTAYGEIDAALEGLCVAVVQALSPGASRTERLAQSRHLHALLDGLALYVLHGMPPRTATNVLWRHLTTLAG